MPLSITFKKWLYRIDSFYVGRLRPIKKQSRFTLKGTQEMKIEIELPDTFAIETRTGVTDSIDMRKLTAAIVAQGALLGIGQKARNFIASALMDCKVAAAGNKRADETEAAYEKRRDAMVIDSETLARKQADLLRNGIDRLESGDWGAERSSAPGLTAVEVAEAEIVIEGAGMKFATGTTKTAKLAQARAKFDTLPAETRAKVTAKAVAKVDADAAERRRKEREALEMKNLLGDIAF
jgi:hypothetical protein